METDDFQPGVNHLLTFKEVPDVLFNCWGGGGYDIGSETYAVIIAELKQILITLKSFCLDQNSRRCWRCMHCVHFADRARKRINISISTFVIKNGGHHIKYPDINGNF